MRIISWSSFADASFRTERGSAASIGVFDGVHLGHMALLDRIVSRKESLMPMVMTFSTNPKASTRRDAYEGDILSLDQKLEVFREVGVEIVVLIDFSEDFGKLGGKEFVGLLRDRGKLRYLAVGSDFRCGHRLDTGVRELRSMNEAAGVETEIVEPVEAGGFPVSSSRIRALIAAGNLVEASALLGRNFEIDLAGSPRTPGTEWNFFDVRSTGRITPPDGRYPASLFDRSSSARTERVVELKDGSLGIPVAIVASRVEFLV
ncbi:MAG: hypothetical protein A2413_08850 [Treponema sp. RIFOXYC1_FULL_61_9]|nr:MAG: hypothetical protein A2Y36_07050 [Treponema sp. GWA1_62_8]OHE67427.1 MAG: hypothetical protein A2001_07430 [Treponema sp. GWC1_61_84]OHE69395.1 MAG: hypothetical protein A2413_08850 [Treponema sp. RIFOXYC1_FULL_61_9]